MALIGFGEVAAVFAAILASSAWPGNLSVGLASRAPSAATSRRLGVAGLDPMPIEVAVRGADLVVSLVPPAAAVTAAADVLEHLAPPGLLVDLTSTGPETAALIAAAASRRGVDFVKGSLLGPVPILREALPIVVAGAAAGRAEAWLRAVGFKEVLALEAPSDAAALKMVWSVVSKGLIALLAESLTAAHRLGMLDHARSLVRSQLGFYGSDQMVARLLGSNAAAGSRRVDEMNDVARTLRALDLPPFTVPSTIAWLETLAALLERPVSGAGEDPVAVLVNDISKRLHVGAGEPRIKEI